MEYKKLPEYEKPHIQTYTDDQIFEMLGPAHAIASLMGDNVI